MTAEVSNGNLMPSREYYRLLKRRNRLSKYLLDVRQGRMAKSEDELQLMRAFVNQYSKFSIPRVSLEACNGDGSLHGTNHNQFEQPAGEHVVSRYNLCIQSLIPRTLILGPSNY